MWWDLFEVRITNLFALIYKDAVRRVHNDEMKLRMLNNKIKYDFLLAMKTNIEMQMNMVPMNMTYSAALANYRNTVNHKFLNTAVNNTITRQRVQYTNTGRGGRGNCRNYQS